MARFDAGTIEAVLRLRDEFTGVATRVATQARTLGTRFTDVGQRARAVGAGLTAGVTLPLVGIGTAAVKASTNLNASMAEIATLIPGNTERVKALKGSVQELAIATGQGTADMAGGLYQVISAVGDTQDTVKILEINARAATAGLSTTSEAIQLTSAVTKGYGDTSSAAFQQVSDLAFQAVKLGQTTFPELAGSIGRVVPLSAELQVSQEELFGVMATGTGVTGGAAEVSTQLRGVLQSLLSPTAGMTTLLASMGLESGKALIEQQGLQGAIETVVGAAARAGAPLQDYVSSIEGQTLALALAGPQADTFTEKLAAMQTATGSTDQAFAEMTEGINAAGHQFKQLWQEVVVTAQRFGDELLPHLLKLKPTINDMLEGLKATVQWFADLPAPVQKTILVTVGLVAALGPLLVILGQMSLGLGALMPLLGSLGSGFAMLMTPSAAFTAVLGKVGLLLAPLKAVLVAVGGAFTVFTWPVTLAIAALAALLVGTEQGRAVLAATGRLIKEGVVFAFNLLRDALEGAWEWTKTFSAGLIDMIPQVVLDSLDSMAKTIGGWADAIGRTNDLSQLTRDLEGLAEGGRLTGEALETVARQAIALRDQGKPLTDELTDVVARFEEMQREAAHLKSMLDALSQVTSLDYLSTVTLQLAESGQTSSEVMKVIAQRAQELQPEGEALSEVLQRVVNAYGEAATAGKGFGDNTGDAGPPVKALSDEVQALVDQFQGRGLIQSALKAAEAVRHVGGVSKLTADDQDQLRETVEGAIDAYRRLGQTAPPAVSALADEIGALADETERLGREQRTRASEGAFAYARAQGAVNRVMESNRLAAVRAQFATHLQTQAHVEATDATFDFERDLGHLRQTMEQGIETAGNMEITLAALAGQLGGAAGQAFNLATAMLEHNRAQDEAARLGEQTSEQFGEIRIGAAQAAGVLHTLGDAIGGTAGAILSEVGNIATAFASGGVVGAVIAGIGAAIKGLKALFSVSQAEKDARAFADAYADTIIKTLTTSQLAEAADAALGAWRGNERGAQFLIGVRDGFVAAGRSAAEAEQLVGRYWKAVRDGSPEAVKAIEAQIDAVVKVGQAVQELQAFDSATDQLQQLTSAAEFFGVAAEEMGARLGNAFQAVEQAATAEDIAQHFHTLLASGVDLGTALDLAKDKVQGVIAASVQMGTEIPASMQPIAAQLIAQGQLLDDSGQKITDINQLEFGTSMTEGLQILVLSMNQLVETMGGEIPAAAKQFAEGVGQSATAAGASLDQQLLAQIANIGLAVHDLSVEDLAQMAAAFEATAQAAGLSLEGVLGEQLDALTTGLGSMSRDALPELVRSFQQTATDAVQAFDRIPRTLTFEHRTRYSSSGLPGATTRSGFQSGTAGRFVDFGVGTAVVLHGRERVVTEAEGRREAADLGALRQELADLKRVMARDQDELPFRLSRAIRDAMAETV